MQSGPRRGSGAKSPLAAPSLYKFSSERQPIVDEMVDPKKNMWLRRAITKFIINQYVPASKINSHEFKNMILIA